MLAERLDAPACVSAETGEGIDALLRTIGDRLRAGDRVVNLAIPYGRGDLLAAVHREGEVVSSTAGDDVVHLEVVLDQVSTARFKEFVAARPA